jgi:Rod binding domain-containing protein
MNVNPIGFTQAQQASDAASTLQAGSAADKVKSSKTREAFDQFVGETFFGQMIKAMRSTVDKPAYFHGGRGEEVFQTQLDQMFAEEMTKASAHSFTGPMFEQFQAQLNHLPRK